MAFDHLLNPVSEDRPCGPDLDDDGDAAFATYLMLAPNRFPVRMVESRMQTEDGADFEPRQIKLAEETQAIAALLERSRDLRLVMLLSRTHLLAGDLAGFCDTLDLAARLLARFPETLHPVDPEERASVLESLDARIAGPLPLQFVPLLRDRRIGPIRYRDHLVAIGTVAPPAGESPPAPTAVTTALASPDNAEAVAAAHARLAGARASLGAIGIAMSKATGGAHVPDLSTLTSAITEILDLIESARTDLAGDAGRPSAADAAPGQRGLAAPSSAADPTRAAPAVPIPDHDAARTALFATERYFAAMEPSSPALVLVRQARILLGRSMVEAVEALATKRVGDAVLVIDPDQGFQLSMERMRNLSGATGGAEADDGDVAVASALSLAADGSGFGSAEGGDPSDPEEAKRFPVTNREEAAALMIGVETFYRRAEPSSPIPLLLQKARSLLGQDFAAVLRELVGRSGQ